MSPDNSSKPTTAKTAISDYLEDLLGSSSFPSSKIKMESGSNATRLSTLPVPKSDASEVIFETKNDAGLNDSKTKTTAPKLNRGFVKTQSVIFEDKVKRDIVAPLVIPSAFPKFAPLPPETEVVEKEAIAGQTSSLVKALEREDALGGQSTAIRESAKPSENRQNVDGERKGVSSSETEIEIRKPQKWLENGRPAWAQKKFECLLFSVAGLKLAVPLISLGAIYQMDGELTPLVGRAKWFLGLHRSVDRNVQVVDTARWVMPDRCSEKVSNGYQFVIRLGGNNWGMACDAVEEAIQLEPSQVKWRTERSKRPWLSGTVIDHMCALLDADSLSYLLEQQKSEFS